MNKFFQKLWNDEGGFILSTEAMILWTITVLGLIVGLVAVRDATVVELTEVANTILTFDQSYTYAGLQLSDNNPKFVDAATTNGSNAQDYAGGLATGNGDFYYVAAINYVAIAPAVLNYVAIDVP